MLYREFNYKSLPWYLCHTDKYVVQRIVSLTKVFEKEQKLGEKNNIGRHILGGFELRICRFLSV